MTRLIRYSTELYAGLEAETGLATGWKQCGSLSVARTPERMTQLRRTIVGGARAGRRDRRADARARPASKWPRDAHRRSRRRASGCRATARPTRPTSRRRWRAARATGGATIFEKTPRHRRSRPGRAASAAVATDRGRIACEALVHLRRAMVARRSARCAASRCRCIRPSTCTSSPSRSTACTPDLPVMRDPDGYIYFKEEVGGLVMGGFEPDAKPWGMDGIPDDFEFQLLPDDWDQFEILMENALDPRAGARDGRRSRPSSTARRASRPTTTSSSARRRRCAGFFVGAGFNSMGIASAGGAGRALAEWIVEGEPTHGSLAGRHPPLRRASTATRPGCSDRVKETLGLHYAMPWPNRELDDRAAVPPLAALRAARRARAPSSAPRWAGSGRTISRTGEHDARRSPTASAGRTGSTPCAAEQRAAARRVGAVRHDARSPSSCVQGRDARRCCSDLCANDIARARRRRASTRALLNARGGVRERPHGRAARPDDAS